MNTLTIPSLLLAAFAVAFPSTALASSFLMQNKTITVPVGKTFSLPMTVHPEGETQYTVRFAVTFPPDLLEVASFQSDPDWLSVSQPGYNLVDNKRGELVKTAGYPLGFSSQESFGVVVFRAKQAGEAVITVGSQSFSLNADSKDTLQSRPQVRVVITKQPTSVPAPGQAVPRAAGTKEPLPDLSATGQNLFDVISEPVQTTAPTSVWFFVALLGWGILLAIIVGVVIARYRHWRFVQRVKKGKI